VTTLIWFTAMVLPAIALGVLVGLTVDTWEHDAVSTRFPDRLLVGCADKTFDGRWMIEVLGEWNRLSRAARARHPGTAIISPEVSDALRGVLATGGQLHIGYDAAARFDAIPVVTHPLVGRDRILVLPHDVTVPRDATTDA